MIQQNELYALYHQLESIIEDPSTSKERLRKIATELNNHMGFQIDHRDEEAMSLANLFDSCLDTKGES